MGADLGPMVVATNANDILDRALKTGRYNVERAVPTLSPAMDIQISSNFERLLFETMDRDAQALADQMNELRETGSMSLRDDALAHIRGLFLSACVSDAETTEEIAKTYEMTGVIVDPHTAVGLRAARRLLKDETPPRVVLATAHPAKFEAAVEGAIGKAPELPQKLATAMGAEERYDDLQPDAEALKAYVRTHR